MRRILLALAAVGALAAGTAAATTPVQAHEAFWGHSHWRQYEWRDHAWRRDRDRHTAAFERRVLPRVIFGLFHHHY